MQRALRVVLAGSRSPLDEVAEEGRAGREYGLVAGQLQLWPEAVFAAAAVRSLVIAVRGEYEGCVRVIARVQQVAQVVLERIGVAELLAEPT